MMDALFQGVTNITNDEKIVVYDMEYLKKAAKLFKDASEKRRK